MINAVDELRRVLEKISEVDTLDDLIEYIENRIAILEE